MQPPKRLTKKLMEKWRLKVKRSGLDDIELSNGSLRVSQSLGSAHKHPMYGTDAQGSDRATYYRNMSQKVATQTFDSLVEECVMNLAADGANESEIAKAVRANGLTITNGAAGKIVKKWEAAWKLRTK